jgi:DNA end-binding protein Ku
MPRPIWKGHISFGLVTIPVGLASAENPEGEISFTMLDRHDQSRIKYQRINEKTGREVAWKDIVKGYEMPNGDFVVVSPEDIKKAAPKSSKSIEITDFVDRDSIDAVYFERPYIVEPLEGGEKGYVLLREAMESAAKVGIAKVAMHTRQHLAALIPVGKALVLNTMRFGKELRPMKEFDLPASAGSDAKVNKREIDMAETLINGMSSKWDPAKYHDEYRDKLRHWIETMAKSGKAKPLPGEEEEEIPGPYNIMDLLKKSVESQKRTEKHATTKRPRRKAG